MPFARQMIAIIINENQILLQMKKLMAYPMMVLLFITSCHDKFEEPITTINPTQSEFAQEMAFSDRKGELTRITMKNGKTLSYEKIDNFNVFEGDILLSDEQIDLLKEDNGSSPKTEAAPGILLRRWTNSSVNFRISIAARRADILWAINHIEANTDIVFNETASGNYIDFVSSTGCSSSLGMQGGRQAINLATGCGRGSIVHEICHALGVFHEQSRPDRGNSIIINWANIESGRSHNFDSELAHNYGPFDFGSIMMYSSFAFSIGSNPTITRLNGTTFPTQRTALSANDINALNDMYPGPNTVRSKSGNIDIGANAGGDVVYLKTNRFFTDLYKNDVKIASYRTIKPSTVDITSSGVVLTNLSGYKSTSGKYRYNAIDISEGGGNIYCLSNNTKNTNLYKQNGSSWTLIAGVSGTRITVDQSGRPWVLTGNSVRRYSDNGSFTTFNVPNMGTWDRLKDIGSAGNEIYVSLYNLRNSNTKALLKFSPIANQFMRQPGSANNLDGQSNGTVWTN